MSGVDHVFKVLELSEDTIGILKDKVGIRRMLHFRTLRGNLIELTISEGVTPAIARDLEIFQKWYLGTYLNDPQRKSIEETFAYDGCVRTSCDDCGD